MLQAFSNALRLAVDQREADIQKSLVLSRLCRAWSVARWRMLARAGSSSCYTGLLWEDSR